MIAFEKQMKYTSFKHPKVISLPIWLKPTTI